MGDKLRLSGAVLQDELLSSSCVASFERKTTSWRAVSNITMPNACLIIPKSNHFKVAARTLEHLPRAGNPWGAAPTPPPPLTRWVRLLSTDVCV